MASKAEAKDWARASLRGLWGVHWLPYDDDFEIDESGLRTHIQRLLEEGEPDGMSVGGTLGEMYFLSLAERKRVAEIVFDEVGGRIPLYYHPTSASTADTLDLAHHAEDIGFDAIMVRAPYDHATSESAVFDFLEHIERNTNIAIVVYTGPHSGSVASPELIAELANLEGVCAVKYVTWTFSEYLRANELAGKKIVVSLPGEYSMLPSILYGGNQVFLTTAINLFQTKNNRPVKRCAELAWQGNDREATLAWYELDPVRKAWQELYNAYRADAKETKFYRHPVAETKYWAKGMGLIDDARVRPPQRPVAPEVAERIDQILETYSYSAAAVA
jgi:4-hydroxy-tetrahydrodipicolinate synthase